MFKDFEQHPMKSQLLWYFNYGLHRFSDIDELPSDHYEKILVEEIKREIPSFEEKQNMMSDYSSFCGRNGKISICASCGFKYLEDHEHQFHVISIDSCESLLLNSEETDEY